ncbi:MAG TPA: hypothetical protein VFP45_02265 [Candidatus Nitrosotalea sp.]|nr:hypothetical protein [Candidatus Nitrosotalea sp.]
MTDSQYDSQIEEIATMILADKISLDEQDETKLKKYQNFAKKQFQLDEDSSVQIVNEAFLYLKLKGSDSVDPLQNGDQFGAGFS